MSEPTNTVKDTPDAREWPEREDGVDAILADYSAFINARPMLMSLLYDIDMLPEQCVTRIGAIRLAGLCEVWRKGETGDLPPAPQEKMEG